MEWTIRKGYASDWDGAMDLAYNTFVNFDAEDYTPEGQHNFKHFLSDPELYQQFVVGNYQLLVALDEERIVGMLLLRERRHIALLFVDGEHHRQGVGHALVTCAADYVRASKRIFHMSVNAAPYAVPFYQHEGFKNAQIEQFEDGIRYIPMKLRL